MRKIVLTTGGTLGDLHPFIAIALALRSRGFAPVLAVPEDQVEKCVQAGLGAVRVRPGFDAIAGRMGLSHDAAVRQIMGNQRIMLEQVLPGLSANVTALEAVAADGEAMVASVFVFASPIVAEKHDMPMISVILQPMAMRSAYDPPHTPEFWMMRGAPVGTAGARWNRFAYAALHLVLDHLYGKRIDRVRMAQGLSPTGARGLLGAPDRALLQLGCCSPQLAPLPRDASRATRIVGFPQFDRADGDSHALDPAIATFLAAGPPPLVFTVGTFAVDGAGAFYERAAAAARALRMRAILLVGGVAPPRLDGDMLRCGYAPHSQLFPHAAAIIHHGGVGTAGQAMRAGKPQLGVPHMGDQHDHAARLVRLGVGLRVAPRRFTVRRDTRQIAVLLRQPSFRANASRLAQAMRDEQGAVAAAAAIAGVPNASRSKSQE
uniref:glycosyltransferase n=1 Tax=uncultured Sphingomonas sp. TaxID=158754 RepID=UPI0035CC38C4